MFDYMNHYVTYFTLFLVYYLGFIKAEQPVIAIYIRCYVPHYEELNVNDSNDYIVYNRLYNNDYNVYNRLCHDVLSFVMSTRSPQFSHSWCTVT